MTGPRVSARPSAAELPAAVASQSAADSVWTARELLRGGIATDYSFGAGFSALASIATGAAAVSTLLSRKATRRATSSA